MVVRTGLTLYLVCAVACGGGNAPPTSPTPAAPTTRVITQGSFSLDAPTADGAFFGLVPITDQAAGTWEATVDWTLATNTLFMYVATGFCTAEQFASPACPDDATCPCQFAVRSEVATPKPRILAIPNAPGGTRTLIVLNLGPREESISYTARLTSAAQSTGGAAATDGQSNALPSVFTARKPFTR